MSKKIYSLMGIVLLASLILAACGGGGAGDDVFKVGFVTDTGGINDDSFNETQYNGVLWASEEVEAIESQYIQSDEATQYEANLTEFASQGYDLVIASGLFLGDATAKVASQYPDINFAIYDFSYPNPVWVEEGTPGFDTCLDNVRGSEFKTDQAAFLAGYLAAGMTKTGKVGYFGGAKIPTVTIFGVGFQAGVEHYNSVKGADVELLGWDSTTGEGLFTNDFVDLTKGKEMTVTLFDQGADIFIPVGGLIGSPGFDVARERGGYGIWVDTDGYLSLQGVQDVILTSVLKVMDHTMYTLVTEAYEGDFEGCSYYVGDLVNEGVGLAPYHDLESEVPADLAAEVEALKADIISGDISDTGCASYPEWCPGFYFAGE
jgi:basic membrane protein A